MNDDHEGWGERFRQKQAERQAIVDYWLARETPIRAANALAQEGIENVDQLRSTPDRVLRRMVNVGQRTIDDLRGLFGPFVGVRDKPDRPVRKFVQVELQPGTSPYSRDAAGNLMLVHADVRIDASSLLGAPALVAEVARMLLADCSPVPVLDWDEEAQGAVLAISFKGVGFLRFPLSEVEISDSAPLRAALHFWIGKLPLLTDF